jgi:hypothetical protein
MTRMRRVRKRAMRTSRFLYSRDVEGVDNLKISVFY